MTVAIAVLVSAALVFRMIKHRRALLMPVVVAGIGFAAADFRTSIVDAPILSRDIGIVPVVGQLQSLEEGPDGRRYIIKVLKLAELDQPQLPARARITWRGEEFNAEPGDIISIRAGLGPPPPPVTPGGFDFARRLYFERIGAVGFAVSAPTVLNGGEPPAWRDKLEAVRLFLFHRITTSAPGQGGAIVAAVVTGKREAISDESRDALRDAGLAHLLAISGLHMGLATGIVFVAVRSFAAMIEPIALRFPIKKFAAATALLSGLIYLGLSGGGWSARRAFIMAAIIFIAILLDRRALSLRNVAIAASLILLTTPEALFHPGFQMSFAAATALIAGFEWWSGRASPGRSFSMVAKVRRYAIGLAATDTLAAVATAPFALYHFNRVAIYSLPANVAAMPLMGFWIMPAAVMGLFLAPLGLDGWAWRVAAFGMDITLDIATRVSSLPGAVSITKQWPISALIILSMGGLWLCLCRAPWRIAGLLSIPAAMMMIAVRPSPIAFVAPSGLNAAIVVDGDLIPYTARRDRFALNMWRETIGLERDDQKPPTLAVTFQCDADGCSGYAPGQSIVAIVEDEQSLPEDCSRADMVIALFPVSSEVWASCDALLIDRRSIWRHGAHAIYINDEGAIRLETAQGARGKRPWSM